MSLNKAFFDRPTNISAKIVADSVSLTGQRITTFEIEYPRFILAELNTHKMLEKNSSSSRAIPIKTMFEQIENNMATPLYWGKNQAGMKAIEEVDFLEEVAITWKHSAQLAMESVDSLFSMGLHKQTANRVLEPYQMMKTVVTATDWDNFFNLRLHKDAQPEFCMLAYKMYRAFQESKPNLLRAGEWHLPYIKFDRDNEGNAMYLPYDEDRVVGWVEYSLEEAQKISASCCAQTSYRKSDDSLEKALKVFEMLIHAEVLHASPFGHLATPVAPALRVYDSCAAYKLKECMNLLEAPSTWQEGVTHMRKDGTLCSGNLAGWVSYRHLLPNNTCYDFNFEERWQSFE